MGKPDSPYLGGKFLIASPQMGDPRFARSVIYICRHGAEGALGLICNHMVADLTFARVLEQLELPSEGVEDGPVLSGGPVEPQRGMVLHSDEYAREDTVRVGPGLGLTGSLEILKDIAAGTGPARRVLALGHSGWSPGQLDLELQDNAWIVGEGGDEELIFGRDLEGKWQRALDRIAGARGVDPARFSGSVGRA